MDFIQIVGARQHNLKNITINIPRNKLVVITGLSGSGKSSLAFDTIYAEGQRRYVESLSSYARQFLDMMEKPDVDLIEGLSPAISIEQKSTSKNPRSTVGTVTEIYDYLRLLYARVGTPFSPETGEEIKSQSVSEIVDSILKLKDKSKILLLSPVVNNRKGEFKKELLDFQRKGFIRFRINNENVTIDNIPDLDKNKKHSIQVVVDRLEVNKKYINRITESVETALNISDGVIYIHDVVSEENIIFSSKFACPVSGFTIEEIEPRLFSFNSPNGACYECDGLGYKEEFDSSLIVSDPNLSMNDGAIIPWNKKNNPFYSELISDVSEHFSISKHTKWKEIDKEIQKQILNGSDRLINIKFSYYKERNNSKKKYEGVIGFLKKRLSRSDLWQRDELSRYMNKFVCKSCNGSRLKGEAMCVKIDKKTIFDISNLSIIDSYNWFESLEKKLSNFQKEISNKIIKEIKNRLIFLKDVGLGYLNLSRSSTTLSGGESQRIRLASQIGSGLTGVLYVLDEPSIGLHQKDNKKLIKTLIKLRDLGNSVIVVEHDEETILAADHLIDIGVGAGINGGRVTAQGSPKEVKKVKNSLTAQYLNRTLKISPKKNLRDISNKFIQIKGASGNNLKTLDVKFPLEKFISITGVSGGGKSSLVIETLYKALSKTINKSKEVPLAFDTIKGYEFIDKIIKIDQNPIGKTPRSNPATYTGCFTFIRDWYANLPESKVRGYLPGRFSFNVKGGRCEKCQGDGLIRIEMHFLADVYVKCESCKGKRFNRETLEVKFKEKSIFDVLDMTVEEGLNFFKAIPSIYKKLETLKLVGLDYIKIGQSATTLSGGEAQRIKLSKELSKRSTGKTIYILDEPTTGLHSHDVKNLLDVLHKLVDKKNTIIVIEHNLDVIKTSDWIIDLGPEGGEKGGHILFEGSLEDLTKVKKNSTAECLREIL
ncbi:excinuclease ABC subunit UvrA [Rickettsiales bacterium]|nr:excinuclease ABC subunit UvrA [Rickettsiales bacterium]